MHIDYCCAQYIYIVPFCTLLVNFIFRYHFNIFFYFSQISSLYNMCLIFFKQYDIITVICNAYLTILWSVIINMNKKVYYSFVTILTAAIIVFSFKIFTLFFFNDLKSVAPNLVVCQLLKLP